MPDFLDKLGGSIDKGIRSISSKGKELIETTRLRGEIRSCEDETKKSFEALGRRVFGMLNGGSLVEEELKTSAKGITELYRRIAELEDSIKKIERESAQAVQGAGAVPCLKCQGFNRSEDKFCAHCGAPMTAPSESTGVRCGSCGSPLKEDARFCIKCGGKVG